MLLFRRTVPLRRGIWICILITALFFIDTAAVVAEYHHVSGCDVCHNMNSFGGPNLYLIDEEIQTPNSGPKPVVFTATTGLNSYADGNGVYDGVCEVCHTQTDYNNNDGHGNIAHFEGEKCTQCHEHAVEFAAPFARAHKIHLTAKKGPHMGCSDCHTDPIQFQPTLFADGQEFATTTVCNNCHGQDVNDSVINAKSSWVMSFWLELLPIIFKW